MERIPPFIANSNENVGFRYRSSNLQFRLTGYINFDFMVCVERTLVRYEKTQLSLKLQTEAYSTQNIIDRVQDSLKKNPRVIKAKW